MIAIERNKKMTNKEELKQFVKDCFYECMTRNSMSNYVTEQDQKYLTANKIIQNLIDKYYEEQENDK